jgi:hypothetical protein
VYPFIITKQRLGKKNLPAASKPQAKTEDLLQASFLCFSSCVKGKKSISYLQNFLLCDAVLRPEKMQETRGVVYCSGLQNIWE